MPARSSPLAAAGLLVTLLGVASLSVSATRPSPPVAGAMRAAHGSMLRAAPPSPAARALRDGHPMDLNRATATDLTLLPRIGPKLAARIVAFRAAHGPFANVAALAAVRGIGPRTVARLSHLVTVHRPATHPRDGGTG